MQHQRPQERAHGAQEEGARGELASSFPARGYGSWAQWKRRKRRRGYATVSIDGLSPLGPETLEWAGRHPYRETVGFSTTAGVTQAIADRTAG